MGRLILVGLLAFAVALVGTAYAEVQNIKVSGDMSLKAIIHHNYDLKLKQKNNPRQDGGDVPGPISNEDDANFFLSTVRVRVDADLTDNVQAAVRLLNQRFWDTDVDATNNIDIDNAYIVLKEFLYSPLTVIAGRQDLNYGTGFIVGPGLLGDPNGMFGGATVSLGTGGEQTTLGQEHSAYNAYDAIRFILDYSPVTVEGLISKINELGSQNDRDEDLYGALVNYKLDQWNAEVEPYWFFSRSQSGRAATVVTVNDAVSASNAARTYEINEVHTAGLRLAGSPIENLKLSGEGAHQWGEIIDLTQYQKRDRDAWGATIDGRYTWAKVPWTPVTGAGWVFFSGEESSPTNQLNDQNDKFNAWDPMFRGSFTTYIQDFLSGQDAIGNLYNTFDANDTSAATNRHLFSFDVGGKPLEDVGLWARYTHARFDKAPRTGRSKHAGDELDVRATYDYTEDVKLTLAGGWFIPGQYYDQPESNTRSNDLAWTIVGDASVKF